jgi:uncharacterized protein (TIGR02246 family)
MKSDVEAIRALLEKDSSAVASGDLDGWIDSFADDIIFMPPNSTLLKGKEAARGFVRPFFDQFNMKIDITVDEIEVQGDWAFARWHYEFEGIPKAGGAPFQEKGKEIWIFKRQADGSWKSSHIIWNTHNS